MLTDRERLDWLEGPPDRLEAVLVARRRTGLGPQSIRGIVDMLVRFERADARDPVEEAEVKDERDRSDRER